jgi:hypothetical protein
VQLTRWQLSTLNLESLRIEQRIRSTSVWDETFPSKTQKDICRMKNAYPFSSAN